jgi:hypothetical protein
MHSQASSVEHDYLKHGFVAGAKEQEIPCADYEVRGGGDSDRDRGDYGG